MDNKRVIRSQKRKANKSPYRRAGNSEGLFSKVKGFFNQSSFWSRNKTTKDVPSLKEESNNPNANDEVNEVRSQLTTPSESGKNYTFKFPEPKIPLLTDKSKNDSIPTSDSYFKLQNKTLAEFFSKKGNEPLSEIEQEGVLSIIRRSNPNTPLKELQDKTIYTTPPHQKVLRSSIEASHIDTPNFVPIYSQASSPRPSSSVRRVYQFSGLPSPYRTKIKVPVIKTPIESPKRIISSPRLASKNSDIRDKSMSQTASTLLSLLDGTSQNEPESKNVELFANPYAISPSHNKRKADDFINSTPSKKSSVSDIERTISHDRTQPLPTNNKYKPAKSSTLRETIVVDTMDSKNTTSSEANSLNSSEEISSEKPVNNTSKKIFGDGDLNATSSQSATVVKGDTKPDDKDSAHSSTTTDVSKSSGDDFDSHTNIEFIFPSPSLPLVQAKFDAVIVQKYKDTFVF